MQLLGHTTQISRLERMLVQGCVPQASLFVGPEHVGKETIATLFARAILLEKQAIAGMAEVAAQGFYADLLTLSPMEQTTKGVTKQKDISVEQVRDVLEQYALTPYQHARKVLLITDAHRLTIAAQNALLKTLEEPSGHAHLLLVTHLPARLLPTIHSRCQTVRFGLVPEAELQTLTQDPAMIAAAAGRPGLLHTFVHDADAWAAFTELSDMAQRLSTASIAQKLQMAQDVTKDANQARQFLEILLWQHRSAAQQEGQWHLYDAIAAITETRRLLTHTNANTRLAMENLLLRV